MQGTVEPQHVLIGGTLVFGCGMAAVTLWYFSSRYLGELSIVSRGTAAPQLCLSVLDFWGRRKVHTFFRLTWGVVEVFLPFEWQGF